MVAAPSASNRARPRLQLLWNKRRPMRSRAKRRTTTRAALQSVLVWGALDSIRLIDWPTRPGTWPPTEGLWSPPPQSVSRRRVPDIAAAAHCVPRAHNALPTAARSRIRWIRLRCRDGVGVLDAKAPARLEDGACCGRSQSKWFERGQQRSRRGAVPPVCLTRTTSRPPRMHSTAAHHPIHPSHPFASTPKAPHRIRRPPLADTPPHLLISLDRPSNTQASKQQAGRL